MQNKTGKENNVQPSGGALRGGIASPPHAKQRRPETEPPLLEESDAALLGDALRWERQRGEGSGVKHGSFFTKRGQGTGFCIQQENRRGNSTGSTLFARWVPGRAGGYLSRQGSSFPPQKCPVAFKHHLNPSFCVAPLFRNLFTPSLPSALGFHP